MTRRLAGFGFLAVLLALPGLAGAFSFLPGGFAPGEKIQSITLAADTGGVPSTPTVSFNTVTNKLVFEAAVSEINTNVASYSIPLGDIIFDSQLDLNSELLLAPTVFPPFNGAILADFTNGAVADFTITDMADLGNLLLAADYTAALDMAVSAPVTAVQGSFDGDFTVLGASDANFAAAFGSAGNYFANLSNFVSNGNPVTTNICDLIVNGAFLCITGVGQIDNFTVNPTVTIVPLAVPEPGALLLLGLVGLAFAGRRRRLA